MNQKRYMGRLSVLTAVLLLISYLANSKFPEIVPWDFTLITISMFFFMSTAVFYLGVNAAMSKDSNAFTRVIMLFTFGKLFLSALLVVGWLKLKAPESMLFVVPFFAVYIIYTIFETNTLTHLSKINAL